MPQYDRDDRVLKVGTEFYWIPSPGAGFDPANTPLNGAEIRGARITIMGVKKRKF
jgi:hypothetical protein